MDNIGCNKLVLTQGVFLSLIRDIAIPKSVRLSKAHNDSKYSDVKFVRLLFDIVNPNCSLDAFALSRHNKDTGYSSSEKASVSAYLSCKRNPSYAVYESYDDLLINLEKCSIDKIYQLCLDKTKKLVDGWNIKSIDKLEKAVCAIFYILQNDNTIDKQSLFYINGKDRPIKKEELSDNLLEEPLRVSFSEFLLGVWMFLVVRETNINGKDTYNYLFPPTDVGHKSRKYNGTLDGKYKRPIEIVCENQEGKESPEKQEVPEKQEIPEEREAPVKQEVPEEQEALKRKHQQSMKRYSETAVIAKELDYQYCCFCDRWNGSLKDIKKDYIAKCVFHKSPKKPMEVACEYFEPDYGRMTLASIGVIDV